MSRSQRLFDLLQILRRHRGAVSGSILADEAGVSLRTIRRDIATLQAMGADIDGEAGVGYILHPGFLLPPLAFTEDELQALMLGAEWVTRQTDVALAAAVRNAMAKIDGVLSSHMRHNLDNSRFYVASSQRPVATGFDLEACRQAVRDQRKLRLAWRNDDGTVSQRIVWPILMGFDGAEQSFAGWYEESGRYCRFEAARVVETVILADRYPGNRRQMVTEWRAIAAELCAQSRRA